MKFNMLNSAFAVWKKEFFKIVPLQFKCDSKSHAIYLSFHPNSAKKFLLTIHNNPQVLITTAL